MQVVGPNSGPAQESISSLRSEQNNHFSWPSGSFAPQLDMVHNPAVGLQGPHYLRSSLMEHRDQNAIPLIRSILDVSFERLQTLQNKDDRRQEILQILCSWLRIRSTFPVKFSSKKIKCTGGREFINQKIPYQLNINSQRIISRFLGIRFLCTRSSQRPWEASHHSINCSNTKIRPAHRITFL
jgi:hypothetical protein